eukprot:scaffold32008_cov63-Phaeocystis_antarctica.AAC.4
MRVRFYRAIEHVRDAAGDAVLESWMERAPHDPTAPQARNVGAVAWQAGRAIAAVTSWGTRHGSVGPSRPLRQRIASFPERPPGTGG